MKLNNLYQYPTSTRALIEGKRHYDVAQEKLPSVTTILAATQSEEKKASLPRGKHESAQEQATRIKDQAASRGTVMHHILEGWIKDEPHIDLTDVGQQAEKMAYQIWNQGLQKRLNEFWGLEVTLYYPGLYAGATDVVGIYDNEESIVDFKQSISQKDVNGLEIICFNLPHMHSHTMRYMVLRLTKE
jgi:hypothetical protein